MRQRRKVFGITVEELQHKTDHITARRPGLLAFDLYAIESAFLAIRCQALPTGLRPHIRQKTKSSMSEPVPESIPMSSDPRSHRPLKRTRGADTALAAQATELNKLFADPEREMKLPDGTTNKGSRLPPPPEIVANVQGSSAGAGSGEFHVYKASRRREYERLREMEAEAKAEEDTARWEKEAEEKKWRDEEKTAKNREKRAKKKGKQSGKPRATKRPDHIAPEDKEGQNSNGQVGNGMKKALQLPRRSDDAETEDLSNGNGNGNGAVVKEVGVVIHDDG